MCNNVNQMYVGKPCFGAQLNMFGFNQGGYMNGDHLRQGAIKNAEDFFNDYFTSNDKYTRKELRAIYQLDGVYSTLISKYMVESTSQLYRHMLTHREFKQVIHSVIQKRLTRLAINEGFKKPQLLLNAWVDVLSKLHGPSRAEFRIALGAIKDRGYITEEEYALFESKLRPLQKMCEIAKELDLDKGIIYCELAGLVIHSYFKLVIPPNANIQTFLAPTINEYDVPVNGYSEIETPAVHTQETRHAVIVDALTKLNPAERFQVFKFVSVARETTPEQFMDITLAGKLIIEALFPNEDITVMRKAFRYVCDQYTKTIDIEFLIGHLLHVVAVIWSERDRFYTLTDFAWIDKPEPLDTSFTDIILKGVNDEPVGDEFDLSRLTNTLEIPQDVEIPKIESMQAHIQEPQGNIGRAGMTVASPKDLLENLARVRNSAIQKAIDEINGILDDEERVRSLAAYDLAKGKVILELQLQSPLGGILAEVMKVIEQAGWSVSSNMGDSLRLEVSSASYL